MPDGYAPSPLPQPDLSGLFADAARALGRLREHAETFSGAAEAVVHGFDEAQDLVRIGPRFSALMQDAQERTRPLAEKGRDIAERSERALERLRAQEAELADRSPREQREIVAELGRELEAMGQDARALREASDHFALMADDLGRRGDKLAGLNPLAGERFRELSRVATHASLEGEQGSAYAAEAARTEASFREMEAELARYEHATGRREADTTEGRTEGGDPKMGSGPAKTTAGQNDPTEETRAELRRTASAQRATGAQGDTEPTRSTRTATLGGETEPPVSLQQALTDAASKTDGNKKAPAPEPERAVGEPATETKGLPTERATRPDASSSPERAESEPASPTAPARDLNSAAIASAIQNTLAPQPEASAETPRTQVKTDPITDAEERAIGDALAELKEKNARRKAAKKEGTEANEETKPAEAPFDLVSDASTNAAPRAAARTEQATINEARAELKEKYAERARNAEILTLYGQRMSVRGWEYLQAHDPARYGQLQAAQTTVQNLAIDATVFLQPQEREAIHLAAVVDVRASFPDLTDELLSALLLQQALQLLDQQEKTENQAALAAIAGVLAGGAAQAAGSVGTPAVFAALAKQIGATREALAHEEKRAGERAEAIRTQTQAVRGSGGGNGASVPVQGGVADLQAQHRQGLDTRRALQATLHAQVQQLRAGNALGNTLARQEALSGAQAQAANGLLALILPPALRQTAQGERASEAAGQGPLAGGGQTEASREQEPIDPTDRAAYENDLAAKLAARQMQDRRFQDISQASVGAGGGASASAASLIGNDGNPLLEGKRLRALSPQEVFARKQAAMRRRIAEFSGTGAAAGGFESMFGAEGDALPNAGAEAIEIQESDLMPLDDGTDEAGMADEEEARLQELLQRQQQDRAQADAASKLDQLNKAKDLLGSPAGKQALAKAAPLATNPVFWVIAALLLIVWLNARLFFPNEESTFRKPLGTWGKVGTIAFDLFAIINAAVSFVIIVIICILPFLPVLLALGGVFATLQGSLRLFGN